MRDLPSGTVTFLFTDVEGSTRLLRDHGVDVKDPTAEEPGISIQGDEGNKETVDKAMEACAPEDAKTQGKTNSNGGGK